MNIGKVIDLSHKEDMILFNTIYHRNIDETRRHDAISLVFKDMKTGKKLLKEIEDPKIEVYKAKDHVDLGGIDHVVIERDKLDKHDVSFKGRTLDIAKLLGKEAENFYWDCLKKKQYPETKQIMMDNRLFSCDRNIEDFYRYKCYNYFGEKNLTKPSKGYFDIEADIKYGDIDFKTNTGDAPVNVVTFLDGDAKISYTLILRDDSNPLISEFEKDLPKFVSNMNKKYDKENGKFEYKIAMFDNELELITFLFKIINTLNLDFIMAWNMGFDIPYLIHRIKVNGGSPKDIICHPDFNHKECYYKPSDEFEVKKKTDWFTVSAYTVYMDQMINYASIRKSQSKLESYKLDFIGNLEVGTHKLDYSDLCSHIRDFPYLDFARYVEYNIIDCMVQYKVEERVNDIDTILYRSYEANTRFNKVFKEVTFLTNVAYKDFKDFQGYVLGNNINGMLYNSLEKNKEKFDGAFVGNPKLVADVGKQLFTSSYSRHIFDNIVDYDYTSLYPTIIIMLNIFKTTMLGKIILYGEPTELEMVSKSVVKEGRYQRGSQYIEDLETHEALYFCHKWLGLPSIEDTIDMVGRSLEIDEIRTTVKVRKIKAKKKKVIKIRRKRV